MDHSCNVSTKPTLHNYASSVASVSPQTAVEDPSAQEPADCVDRARPDNDVEAGVSVTGPARVANVGCPACRPVLRPQAVTDTSQNRCRRSLPGRGTPEHCPSAGDPSEVKSFPRTNSAGLWWWNREVQIHGLRAVGPGGWWWIGRHKAMSRHAGQACCDRPPALDHASRQSLLYQALYTAHIHTTNCQHTTSSHVDACGRLLVVNADRPGDTSCNTGRPCVSGRHRPGLERPTRLRHVSVNLRIIPYCGEDASVFPDLLTLTTCVTLTL